jgi:hypothetical protein
MTHISVATETKRADVTLVHGCCNRAKQHSCALPLSVPGERGSEAMRRWR